MEKEKIIVDFDNLKTVINSILSNISEEDKIKYFGERMNNCIEDFFQNYFKLTEGNTCCADKAGFVVSKIRQTVKEKKYLSLKQTYQEYKDAGGDLGGIKDDLDRLAYWCPRNLETTREAMDLYDKYLSRMQKFIKEIIDEK